MENVDGGLGRRLLFIVVGGHFCFGFRLLLLLLFGC